VKDAVCVSTAAAAAGGGRGSRGSRQNSRQNLEPTHPPTATLLIWHRRRSQGCGVGGGSPADCNPVGAGGNGGRGARGREGMVVCLAWRAGRGVGGAGKGRGGVMVRFETLMGWVKRWKLRGVCDPLQRLLIDTHSLQQVWLMCG
jgi:hypothetical protein